jgi:hypothetical protein
LKKKIVVGEQNNNGTSLSPGTSSGTATPVQSIRCMREAAIQANLFSLRTRSITERLAMRSVILRGI